MTDRTVKAILKADASNLVNGMKQAQKATDDFAKKASKSATDNKAAWTSLGQTSLIAGAALAAGIGLAVKAFADFDKEMSVVRAVSGATAGEMDKLRAAAMKAGADTKYSAAEAAKAEGELAKIGIKTADILGGALLGSLNLAAAGNIDLAEAATISGQAMKIFSLAGKDVGHIADVLASGANKSAADVSTLGQALQQGGLVAAQTGLTLEETVGTLAAFSDNALNGSDAGTSLKSMLQRLTPQSAEAAAQMKAVGFSAYDAQGNFKGMSAVAENLKTSFQGLTPEARASAMGVIFGSDAVRAANVLYKIGAIGVDEYTKAVQDDGAAARVAAIQMDNLSGDMEQLKGSIETALIQAGSNGNGVLRDMAQFATKAVNGLGGMPEGAQKAALGIGSVAAAGLLTIGAIGTLYPKLQETKKALETVGITGERASKAMGGLGKAAVALAIAVTAAKALQGAMSDVVPGVEATRAALLKAGDATTNLDTLFKSIDANGMDWVPDSIKIDTLAKAFERVANKTWAENISDTTDAMIGLDNSGTRSAAVFTNIGQSLAAMVGSGDADKAAAQFDAIAKKLGLSKDEIPQLLSLMPQYSEAVQGAANAAQAMVGGIDATTGSVIVAIDPVTGLVQTEKDLAKAADDAKQAHDDLKAAIEGFGSVALDARGAARDYQAALDGATKALKDNGRTLDTNTEKGRANQVALEAIGTSALKSATANFEHGASVKSVTADVVAAHGQFVTFATKMGMSKDAANKLANELGLTTDNVKRLGDEAKKPITIKADSSLASAAVKALDDEIKGLKGKVVTVGENGGAAAIARVAELRRQISLLEGRRIEIASSVTSGGRGHTTMAAGGYVAGPGTGTSDSINARLSNGEYVVKASAVKDVGVATLDRINARFAAGGYVETSRASVSATAATSGNTFHITEVSDPIGTANAVARRQAQLAAI